MGQGAEAIVTVGSVYRVSKAQFFKLLLSMQGLIVSMHMYVCAYMCSRAALHSRMLNFEFLRNIFYD